MSIRNLIKDKRLKRSIKILRNNQVSNCNLILIQTIETVSLMMNQSLCLSKLFPRTHLVVLALRFLLQARLNVVERYKLTRISLILKVSSLTIGLKPIRKLESSVKS